MMKKNKTHWISWNKLCQDKSKGGMGFRDLQAYNNALLAKQVWRLFHNPNALWAKVLKAKYFPNSNLMAAHKGRSPSWVWSSLIAGRATIEANAR